GGCGRVRGRRPRPRGAVAVAVGGACGPRRHRRSLHSAAPGPVVPGGGAVAGIGPMSGPDSLQAFLAGAAAVANHQPWPRIVVDAAAWEALRDRLATADWSLLGLWGDRGNDGQACVHLALRDEGSEGAD